jgi:hypothetical protein
VCPRRSPLWDHVTCDVLGLPLALLWTADNGHGVVVRLDGLNAGNAIVPLTLGVIFWWNPLQDSVEFVLADRDDPEVNFSSYIVCLHNAP